jgi:hypothetical protein
MVAFEAKTTGLTTSAQIKHINDMRVAQNNLTKSGGAAVTVPQFGSSGLSAGPGPYEAIQGMAGKQMQANAQGGYNHCIGQPAGACGDMGNKGGSRRRKRSRKRSRKKKVKKQQK